MPSRAAIDDVSARPWHATAVQTVTFRLELAVFREDVLYLYIYKKDPSYVLCTLILQFVMVGPNYGKNLPPLLFIEL